MCKIIRSLILILIISNMSCSSDDDIFEETKVPPTTNVDPVTIQGKKNQFDIKSIANIVLLNKSVNLPTGKTIASKSVGNFFLTDDKGNITNLKIPNAKDYILTVNSLMECSKNLILVSGILNVEYLDGTTDALSNFILDKTDGAFYKLSDLAYTQFVNVYAKINQSSRWINGSLQFDDNNAVYLKGNNTGAVQEIYKAEFVKISEEAMEVKFTTINLIAQNNRFNYYVLGNGDILYTYNFNQFGVWKIRFSAGQTIALSDLNNSSPLDVDGVNYFENVNSDGCFGVRASDGGFVFFISGQEIKGMLTPYFIKPFRLTTNNGSFTLQPIPLSIPYREEHLNKLHELASANEMFYFNSNNLHVFTSWGGPFDAQETIWWSFDDLTNTVKTAFTKYSSAEFGAYYNLIGRSDDYACIAIGQDVHFVNFENLTENVFKNIGFEIFKTEYRNNNVLQFYGISYASGKKVYGEIGQTGDVKIINEFEDSTIEVKDIVKIGNF